MRLVVGHANPDFDAYASTVAAARLFADAYGIFLGSQNANVRAFHNLHEDFLPFVEFHGLDTSTVTSVVMVDTRDPERIGEAGAIVGRPGVETIIYDHHPHQEGDLADAVDRGREVGATTSILVHELQANGLTPTPLEASLYLLGIHEDTGSLTYPNTTAYDVEATAWLMSVGADLEVLNEYLSRSLSPAQRTLLGQIESSIEVLDVHGQQVALGIARAAEYVDSASVLTHYIVEELGYGVAIGVIEMPGRLQVVARSRIADVDVGAVMGRLGGGGHAQAASAGFRGVSVEDAVERVKDALAATVRPPVRAGRLMSSPVRTIGPSTTMAEAGETMARWGHGGLPVVEGESLEGLVTRKDVDKALRHGLGHAPVRGFMRRDVTTVGPSATLSELERLLGTRGIGRVPVIDGTRLVGIVTRKDVLRSRHGSSYVGGTLEPMHPEARRMFLDSLGRLLPARAQDALHVMGELAVARGVRVHVVGGFVRDMLLGRSNLDVDVVVEGDGLDFAQALAEHFGARFTTHRRFGTAVIRLSGDVHIDVASSRAEYYTRPGALPTVEISTLQQDLFRRDFTINAMAASLAPDSFGVIADPFGGLGDLQHRRIRVLHALSFVDDPTRLLRAARFEVRYGFALDEHTLQIAAQAAEMDLLSEVSGARIREELYGILAEERPERIVARLTELGAVDAIVPEGVRGARVPQTMDACVCAAEHLQTLGAPAAPRSALLLSALAVDAEPAAAEHWIRHLRVGRTQAASVRDVVRAVALAGVLDSDEALRDSRLYRMLAGLDESALACLWTRLTPKGRERVERYVTELATVKAAVTGEDLIAAGAVPGEAFSAILAQALDDRLDGRVVGREAELAHLGQLARRAGLIDSGKEEA